MYEISVPTLRPALRKGDETKMETGRRTPNDQRSDVKNPNNPGFEKDRLNRENQKGPASPAAQKPSPAPRQEGT